jgi:uncharacterized membrane protein
MRQATKQQGVPEMGTVTIAMLITALKRGWKDMRQAPVFGLIVAGLCVGFGLGIAGLTYVTGQSYWLLIAAVGFPLFGPFAAVVMYEVSHRIEQGAALDFADVFGVVLHQRRRQLPSICVIIIMVFLFWFFIAHMIFALFMGLSAMTNVSSSLDIYFTREGLTMLAVGSLVGGMFALLFYMITVISLPLLLDREVDFVTAMITSFQVVQHNFVPMIIWGGFVAGLTFLAMIPAFFGLFIVLPLLGHATWHLYRLICEAGEAEQG